MKLYSVKPEYCYSDDKDQQRKAQLDMLAQVGVKESEALGITVCSAEQALSLILAGYCGKYLSNSSILEIDITNSYDVQSEVDISSVIKSSVFSSVEAVGKLFNKSPRDVDRLDSELNVRAALRAAVAAIYFNDSREYTPALFRIVRELGGGEAEELTRNNPAEAYARYAY